ncbi:hypothetical protein EYZ11_011694 [Aspergillus tanneri]|uniref:ABC-type Fe3+ transport system n=1 Tax=Aspergillus tanneri TaxID=1220188 RepID=A0A4S3J253_9EURO|nr:hypothetical protein EYZ11_011694 [Aspergillus tanneri]
MRKFLFLCLAGSSLATVTTQSSYPSRGILTDTRSLDEIYAAASTESGELTVLWGGDAPSQASGVVSAWKAKFPNIPLNLTVDVSKYHDSRVDREFQKSGSDGADIAILQTVHDFDRWKRAGRLLSYKPAGWDNIYSSIKDPSGAYTPLFINGFGNIIYNTERLQESQVPSRYDAFVDPFWKGKLALTYPNDDDAIAFLFVQIIEKYGWDWLESLAQQDIQWVRGTQTPGDILSYSNSTRSITFTTSRTSQNTAIKIPEDGRMSWPQSGAIFATSQHRESAKLFMSWLLSDEAQKTFSRQYSVRKDLGTPGNNTVWDDPTTGTLSKHTRS